MSAYTGGELNKLNGDYGVSAPYKSVPVMKLIRVHRPKSKDELYELIKVHYERNCERGVKSEGTVNRYFIEFGWQGGYGGFSVSPSLHDKTKNYIIKQEEHHKKMSFKEEYLLFLKEYGIEYNEQYLWTD
jgi:putative transposase